MSEPAVTIRTHRPGDIGWVISRHGALYAAEYGWTSAFEALVAGIGAAFLRSYDERFERCFIAEMGGRNAGSAMVVRCEGDPGTAQLRLVIVEPAARGHGVGRRLVAEAIGFARAAGYRRMMLWTSANLHAARRIYQAAGFRLVREEPHDGFGRDFVAQSWELELG